jgi:hypothetical protein
MVCKINWVDMVYEIATGPSNSNFILECSGNRWVYHFMNGPGLQNKFHQYPAQTISSFNAPSPTNNKWFTFASRSEEPQKSGRGMDCYYLQKRQITNDDMKQFRNPVNIGAIIWILDIGFMLFPIVGFKTEFHRRSPFSLL